MRLAVAAAREPLKRHLKEKEPTDGWTSRLLQRVLTGVLQGDELVPWLDRVRSTYRTRRERATKVLVTCEIPSVVVWPASDGVNLWISLPFRP